MHKYGVIVYWNTEDGVFVAAVPELPGCVAHGDTEDSGLREVGEAVESRLKTVGDE